MSLSSLYVVCDLTDLEADLRYIEALLTLRVSMIQLRAKDALVLKHESFSLEAIKLRNSIYPSAKIIINDDFELAVRTGADGVHLGQEDSSPLAARAAMGTEAIIGFSTHTLAQAKSAPLHALTYLAFGPVFPSQTKSGHAAVTGLSLLKEVTHAMPFPVVAIGGITPQNAESVFHAGAASVAVIAAVRNSLSLPKTIEEFRFAYERAQKSMPCENPA
jgi:thiamine-phosphate pyrophosphorylase